MLTQAGFELAPLGYWSTTLLVKLSSPQGLEVSYNPTQVHEIFLRQLNALSMTGCAVFQFYFRIILRDTHPHVHL